MYINQFIIVVLVVILQCMIVIGIHEVGHILLAVNKGWYFFYMIVGPVGVKHLPTGGNRFFLERKMRRWGGAAAVASINYHEVTRKDLLTVVAAGPVCSLVFGVASILIGYLNLRMYWYNLGVLSLIVGAITLMPHRVGYSYSDGGKIKCLLSEGNEVELALARYRIGASILIGGGYGGVRYGDCRLLIDSSDIKDQYMGTYYAYRMHQANGAFRLAAENREKLHQMSVKLPSRMIKRI